MKGVCDHHLHCCFCSIYIIIFFLYILLFFLLGFFNSYLHAPDSLSQLSTSASSHYFKYGEDVDKSYHEINVNSEKRININNVEENVREHNPTISKLAIERERGLLSVI